MQGQLLPTSSDGLGGNSVGVLKHMNLAGKWADTYQVGMTYVYAHTSEMGQDAFSYSLKTQESRASESHIRKSPCAVVKSAQAQPLDQTPVTGTWDNLTALST